MSAALNNPHDESSPSAFEVLAGQRLMPSLRLALHYVLAVGAQRYPHLLLRLHNHREEVTLALTALLEGNSLASHNASFGEHFYNLCRRPAESSNAGVSDVETARWRKRAALILLLLPMYARTRLESIIEPDTPDEDAADGGASAQVRPPRTRRQQVLWLLWRILWAVTDGACLLQLLSFLYGHSPYPSLQHRFLGVLLQRQGISPPAATAGPQPATTRGQQLASVLALPLRHAQHLLLISVFGFRLLEHWHMPQHASASHRSIPVPPPPLLPPLPAGRNAWSHSSVCPTCRMAPQDPTASPSGFVFCAKCIYPAVAQTGRCPATHQPLLVAELRRLYETSRPAAPS